MKLIEQYTIPGIKKIAISTVEIYCNNEGLYFGRFKDGLTITIFRDSLEETKIKMFEEVREMLIHGKGIAGEIIKNVEVGLEYLTKEISKHNQAPKETKPEGEENK